MRLFYKGKCIGEIDKSAARILLNKKLAFEYELGILFLRLSPPKKKLKRPIVVAKRI
ncbi:Uncharacterised protein [uncultured archaeon]|nr:Uncharacterised protein [uncultured archaeon]